MTPGSWIRMAVLYVVFGGALFVFAQTLNYWQGWLYLGFAAACHLYIVNDLKQRDPELLERRRKAGSRAETRPVQKHIIRILVLVWLAVLPIAGADHRLGWSDMPLWLNLAGAALFLIGQTGMLWVFRTNTYARATVEVSEGQTVTDSGPYAIVRHPMYTTMVMASLGSTLLLGSWPAFALGLVTIPLLGWRLLDEEEVMVEELKGYPDYRLKVRSRLIPGIW